MHRISHRWFSPNIKISTNSLSAAVPAELIPVSYPVVQPLAKVADEHPRRHVQQRWRVDEQKTPVAAAMTGMDNTGGSSITAESLYGGFLIYPPENSLQMHL